MLIQDHIFETTTVEAGYAVNDQNDRFEAIISNCRELLKKMGMDDSDM